MKRYFNFPLAIILLAGVFVVSAKAQTSGAQRLIANIPFTFTVAKTTLPAGRYTITVLNPSSDRKTLQVRSMDGHSSAIVLTTAVNGKETDNAKLVFERYGDDYYFAQAQMAGDSTTLAAVRSKREKQAIAKANKKSVVVIVAG
jgi:hypothetical protein